MRQSSSVPKLQVRMPVLRRRPPRSLVFVGTAITVPSVQLILTHHSTTTPTTWIEPFSYWATSNSPGSSGFSLSQVTSDIKAAKAAGADYVVVMPHWGIEYTDAVLSDQTDAAAKMIGAGADLILGSHSHWFGAMAQAGADKLIFYSFGDLVFDWTHDELTQESAVADMTFVGTKLVQVDLRPILIIDGQPNLLDHAGDGKVVLDQIRATSGRALGW